jgi:hypothetical protein
MTTPNQEQCPHEVAISKECGECEDDRLARVMLVEKWRDDGAKHIAHQVLGLQARLRAERRVVGEAEKLLALYMQRLEVAQKRLGSVVAERDSVRVEIAALRVEVDSSMEVIEHERYTALRERDEARESRTFAQQWYAVRFERLRDLAKEHGIWDKAAAIMANGTVAGLPGRPYEPPTYAQLLNQERHRAEKAEQERDRLAAAQEWRAIESAPKDGMPILAFCEPYGVRHLYWHQMFDSDPGMWVLVGGHDVFEPTHWQPLPAPPKESGS